MADLGVNLDRPYAQAPEGLHAGRRRCAVIEPTSEMDLAVLREADGGPRAAVVALLAIIERDYDVTRKGCRAEHPSDDVMGFCGLLLGHEGEHFDSNALTTVRWS